MKKKVCKVVRYEMHIDENTKMAAKVPIYRMVEVDVPFEQAGDKVTING
jgi:hypothetical protein